MFCRELLQNPFRFHFVCDNLDFCQILPLKPKKQGEFLSHEQCFKILSRKDGRILVFFIYVPVSHINV